MTSSCSSVQARRTTIELERFYKYKKALQLERLTSLEYHKFYCK